MQKSQSMEHWTRQARKPRNAVEKVYKIEKISPGNPIPLVVAFTSKVSAQRFISQMAEAQSPDRYRVSVFTHPLLPGFQGIER